MELEYKENQAKKENNYTPQCDTFALLRFGEIDREDDKLSQVSYNIDSAIRRSIEENVDLCDGYWCI